MLGGKIDVRDVPTLEFEARRPVDAGEMTRVQANGRHMSTKKTHWTKKRIYHKK